MKVKMFLAGLFLASLFTACDKDSVKSLGGDTAAIAEEGVVFTSSYTEIAGVSSISAEITDLEGDISIISGSATITNESMKNILANFPEAEVEGDQVTISDIEFKHTTEGIASVKGLAEGVIVRYDAEVGDEYKTKDGVRKVISRSTDDDYPYGFWYIKVIEVEETLNKHGVKKIKYWANHRFGMVAMEFTFDDNTTAKFPIYASVENH